MAPSIWARDNKTYTLFGEAIKMPLPTKSKPKKPMVLLFDIGGVCVVSPFQAILDYEKSKGIPLGYVNVAISQTGRDGAWQRLERGEYLTDKTFFSHWKRDLENEQRWRAYYKKYLEEQKKQKVSDSDIPAVPDIDAEWLHNEMMSAARQLDPNMGPALKRLRQHADQNPGTLFIGALSNTSIFPPSHKLYDATTTDGKASKGLDGIFDVFVSSAHIGMRKPDEEAYKYAITRLHEFVKGKYQYVNVEAGDVVFLDDIGTNLRTARNLGMKTIKVKLGHVDEAVKELEEATGLDLSSGKAKL